MGSAVIKILHLSDIHMGSGFNHGRINPETGLNTRLEDFIAALGQCINRAMAEPVDLVLLGGCFPQRHPASHCTRGIRLPVPSPSGWGHPRRIVSG